MLFALCAFIVGVIAGAVAMYIYKQKVVDFKDHVINELQEELNELKDKL